MSQINTPYPATCYLTGFLRKQGFDAVQEDPSLELVLKLFSSEGISDMHRELLKNPNQSPSVRSFLNQFEKYHSVVDSVTHFLQGKNPTLAHRLAQGGFLPQGPRFNQLKELERHGGLQSAFGELGILDRAKYFASLFIDDLADTIRDGLDEHFGLSRYAEKLALSAASLSPILDKFENAPTLVERYQDQIARHLITRHQPIVVGITIPFPGNLYGGLRMARVIKEVNPKIRVIVGGGYVNTELRELSDPRFFKWIDFVTLDDGEAPFLAILNSLKNESKKLLRTFVLEGNSVRLVSDRSLHDIPLKDAGTPTYDGLPLDRYLSTCELLNPMHRLWSDGRWNKLTLAHGCYWKRCAFCDTSLKYISDYEPVNAKLIVDRMESLINETGQSGFHFVDEAAPPSLLRALSQEILSRKLVATWWTNIRFEKSFTNELTSLMNQAGCIAVSGGLEVASNRLLKLMDKGVTVEQVAQVTRNFAEQNILVHAYLMYGFPTQTLQETIDSLERVRQLFMACCIQSAYWHRFSVTHHSPIGQHPEMYGIELIELQSSFAKNDIQFVDKIKTDHEGLRGGLTKAVYNYMHGLGIDESPQSWFDFRVPKTKVAKNWVRTAILKTKSRPKIKKGVTHGSHSQFSQIL